MARRTATPRVQGESRDFAQEHAEVDEGEDGRTVRLASATETPAARTTGTAGAWRRGESNSTPRPAVRLPNVVSRAPYSRLRLGSPRLTAPNTSEATTSTATFRPQSRVRENLMSHA